MALRKGSEYIASLKSLGLEANVMGKETQDLPDHPLITPSVRAVASTFDCAYNDETRSLFRVRSSLSGEEVNRFTHLHQSPGDLMKKVLMQRHCGNITACCFQRCVGMDAANAVFSVTYECDQEHDTDYHKRFREYWTRIQIEDLVVDGAMTDPKGDRGKRPKDQSDPDLFLRVVERKRDGVIVRGAKLHQTGMVNSHEIIVMPTTNLVRGEEDWAICFAIPTNTRGIKYIYGRQASDTRKLEGTSRLDVGNPAFGGQEVMTVFDDVFVPHERLFLNGEIGLCGRLVERFAAYHRQSYGGCKVGVGDILIGATALIARMNGVESASHIRDKIIEMIHLNETMFACGIACSALGHETKAGNYEVDMLLANVCKLNVTRFPFELARLATDIAGGLLGTMPSAQDMDDPVAGPYIKKYLAVAKGVDVVDRMKVLRLIENIVAGAGAVAYLIESVHGAGSPMAQRIMIGRQGEIEGKINRVKGLLDIC
ncbi:MAG TPA: 4-hydroxyphenylacetate 3-hydroxylase N-terminal domain-containing protein [Thermodesulfobacteriota bacterium]|nr:4-hydroxyphenylacetate 3-hydroxylase N-terminal domain-containing protein [Thermodesulfobacteriota bacterium]